MLAVMSPDSPASPQGPVREAPDEEKRPPSWILPVVMVSILTIGGWYVIQNLSDNSRMEDCTMAGRHNCVPPIDTSKLEK